MGLSRSDVEKVALLARLQFTDDELDTLTAQLGQIVAYVHQLAELNTDDVEPITHAVEFANVLAADVAQESFDRDKILANAPSRDDECYRVPPVL